MRTAQTVVAGFVTLVLASCTSVAPVKVNAGDQCYRCRRTIVDERLAGEIVGTSGFIEKFRAPGCMAKYLATHPEETGKVFVTDYVTAKMIAPREAFYVPLVLNRDTGERDYRAYRNKAEAEAFARAVRTATVDWDTVMENAR